MSILEPVNSSIGSAFILGEFEPLLPYLSEDKPSVSIGPVTCVSLQSPKDRTVEYLGRFIARPDTFSLLGMSLLEDYWMSNGIMRPVFAVAVGCSDPLVAYTKAKNWIGLIKDEITSLLAKNVSLASKFEPNGAPDLLTSLDIKLHVIVCSESSPDASFLLALRRLAKDRKQSHNASSESEYANSLIVVPHCDVGHPNVQRLRFALVGDEECFVVPSTDDGIDSQLPKDIPAESKLGTKAEHLQSREEQDTTSTPLRTAVGLNVCLRNIWDKFGKDNS